ncbi:hypothetical protein CGI20_15745 [Vibrio parahaemolyticus]|uniref:hypothetical protein n=1 Tax=Vibrio harveyi group TaxID=717610 RepID=UPI00111EF57C|nr:MULTISPECIES: hypothetical protein [Vibrio harveyi group]TOK37459.1 hypothetical protein CGI20_15745 [Vibrio parahaemolyticus]WEK81900.1 hypothetical protein PY250_23595 [Vibrio alginolyticus]
MLDNILARYWQPKGTPLHKHHLQTIVIGFVLSLVLLFVGVINREMAFSVMILIVVLQFLGMWLARKRFGNRNPNKVGYKE